MPTITLSSSDDNIPPNIGSIESLGTSLLVTSINFCYCTYLIIIIISLNFVFELILYLLGGLIYVSKEEETNKAPSMEAFRSVLQHEYEPDIVGVMYDDTTRFLEKGKESLKWDEVYQMLKKQNCTINAENQDELKFLKNIRKSRIDIVVAHSTMFPCVDAIAWILKHGDLGNRYMYNARGDPIDSFQPADLVKCYHLEKGTWKLDNELLGGFKHPTKDMYPICYKPDKQFKLRPMDGYPTTFLRKPYQYMVVILCRLYEEPDASNFSLSYIPLIHYCVDEGLSFN
jgi:hypothetical protein